MQAAVVDVLVDAVRRAVGETDAEQVAVVGGVAANSSLRRRMEAVGDDTGIDVFVPDRAHCMDNAAMIAQAGAHRLAAGHASPPTLDVDSSLQL